jgi:hypothetical protein
MRSAAASRRMPPTDQISAAVDTRTRPTTVPVYRSIIGVIGT